MTTAEDGTADARSGSATLAPIANPRLVDVTVDKLRAAIIRAELAPGQRLVESSLATTLGISRGPLREALQVLEQEGLVVTVPRRGRFVQSADLRTLDEVYSLRRIIEPFAAERALRDWSSSSRRRLRDAIEAIEAASRSERPGLVAERDIEFHATLIELADHRLLSRTWNDSIAGNLHLLLNLTTATHSSLYEAVRRHTMILDALEGGDPAAVRAVVEEHIDDALRRSRTAYPVDRHADVDGSTPLG